MSKDNNALDTQVGGTHYQSCKIQPVQFIQANELGFLEGCVVKRLVRYNRLGGKGRQDLEKAIHELQLLIEHKFPLRVDEDCATYSQPAAQPVPPSPEEVLAPLVKHTEPPTPADYRDYIQSGRS